LEKSLVIITKKGKIKYLPIEKLQKISKSGKKILSLYQKIVKKCNLHQEQSIDHKNTPHECGISCSVSRELQKQIKTCPNCSVRLIDGGDKITKTALINEDEEIELIIKRKAKNGKIKNLKISVYRQVRIKELTLIAGEEVKMNKYCSKHQSSAIKHLTIHKKNNVTCDIRCPISRNLHKVAKTCSDCQNPHLFIKKPKKQIKCEQVVDLVVNKGEEKQDLLLLLVKKDSTLEKKKFASVKSWISSDTKLKKTNYCKKH